MSVSNMGRKSLAPISSSQLNIESQGDRHYSGKTPANPRMSLGASLSAPLSVPRRSIGGSNSGNGMQVFSAMKITRPSMGFASTSSNALRTSLQVQTPRGNKLERRPSLGMSGRPSISREGDRQSREGDRQSLSRLKLYWMYISIKLYAVHAYL